MGVRSYFGTKIVTGLQIGPADLEMYVRCWERVHGVKRADSEVFGDM